MKLHANAPLGPKGRATMVGRVLTDGLTLAAAAAAAGVSVRTAGKWVRRYRAEGEAGLLDRSSTPELVANATPEDRVQVIATLRKLKLTGQAADDHQRDQITQHRSSLSSGIAFRLVIVGFLPSTISAVQTAPTPRLREP